MASALRHLLVALAIAAALPCAHAGGEAKRTFSKARLVRGDTNVKALSGIDNASWIWAAGEPAFVVPQGNEFRKFRIEFDSTEEAPHLDFSVSADSRYYLTIDGKLVSRGPNRSTTENWQFQSYRVALKPGRHVVEATVWQLTNTMAPLAQLTWQPGFVFYAAEPYRKALTTGIAKWKCGKVDCIRRFDGKDTAGCGWATGGQWEVVGTGPYAFEPKEWKDVAVVRRPITAYGSGARAPGWMLFPTQLPDQTETKVAPGRILAAVRGEPMRAMYEYSEADTKSPDVAALNELVGKGKKFVVPPRTSIQAAWHLGEYICAYPILRTNGGKGAKVSWTWAESPRTRGTNGRNGKKGRRDTIVGQYLNTYGDMFVCDGRQGAEFSIPWFRCGLWCKIDIATADEPLEITGLELVESRYPLEDEAGFSSKDDPSLADIRRICRRAMQMCCHEMLFDCPYYEQQMYPGDTRVQLLVLSALSRDDRIIKRAIELYDLGTRDDGMCPFNWPTRGLQEGFTYTLCYLMMYGDYAMNHADRAWLRARIPGMRKSMAGCEIYENSRGLVENTPGWNFMDWTPGWNGGVPPGGLCGDGVNSEINLQWLLAVESAAKAERALGNELQAQYWDEKAERLKKAIVDAFWCEERGLLAETPDMKTFSEHSQAMAIIADALPKDKLERCAKALADDPGLARCTVYFSYYLFEAYFKIGRADLFQRRLDMWRGYVAKGLTTLLEEPDEGEDSQSEPRSDCHAWGAHPIWFMQTGLAGIKPAAPFFEKVLVEPQPGALKSFHVRHPHPKGFVEADLDFTGGMPRGTISTPVEGVFRYKGLSVELKPGRNEIGPQSPAAQRREPRAEIKVMTFNVMHCKGVDGKIDIGRTAARIRAESPDFACLQEIDCRTARVNGVDEPAELARLTGMHATFAKAISFMGGEYGVMMLSHEKPLGVRRIPLPGAEPRVLLVCEFGDCVVATSHLSDGDGAEREAEIPIVRTALARYAKPVFFAGDWNDTPGSDVLAELGKFLAVLSTQSGHTWHGDSEARPDITPCCIDYIAVDAKHAPGFGVVDTHVVEDRVTSDHAPVVATVSFPRPVLPAPTVVPAPVSMRLTGGVWRAKASEVNAALYKTTVDPSMPEEGYRISVTEGDGVAVTCADDAGAFYALQTLRQIATTSWGRIAFPCCEIEDWPRFGWRGVHIDDSRHFFGKAAAKRVIDLMAMHKMNVLHWHLTDDHGWRLPVAKYPRLTTVGATRRLSSSQKDLADKFEDGDYGPFAYTRAEIDEVVAYARDRFVRVVPEVDVPGHSAALLRAYPQFGCFGENPSAAPSNAVDNVVCAGDDRAVAMLKDVFDEVAAAFPGEIVHIGGDEVDKANYRACPKCQARMKTFGLGNESDLQAWLAGEIAGHLAKKGRRVVGWDEILLDGAPPKGCIVMSWRGAEGGRAAAAAGHQAVMCPHERCYLDYSQCLPDDPVAYPYFTYPLPLEKVYSYDPLKGIPEEQHKWIIGGQCCNWSEYTCNETELQWKMWPRACATAEVFWLPAGKRDFADFSRRMEVHRHRLIRMGVNCAPLR